MSYLCPQHSANLSECLYSMAKIRVMSNQRRVGRVGDTTYYVRDGEQIARQSRNNSNYGDEASRSEAQQRRRVRWGNLVNYYKANAFWMPKAFESVKPGQTMYNRFMQLNINESIVSLTKDMAASGCCVLEDFQVSQGSLPRVVISQGHAPYDRDTSIVCTITPTATTTVGDFATDILANNEEFQEGDNLAFIYFFNWKDAYGYPYTKSVYKEVTLVKSSAQLLNTIFAVGTIGASEGNQMGVTAITSQGFDGLPCIIHTRKVGGSLKVSTAFLYDTSQLNIIPDFIGEEWVQECIDSYGVDGDVPLDPSFNSASIQQVTANGSAVDNADVLQGSQQLRVYGTNLSGNLQLFFNDVEYTPLFSGDGFLGYILGDNGTVRLFINGRLYMTFSVSEIVIPSELPTKMFMEQWNVSAEAVNRKTVNSTSCLQYPYLRNDDYPIFAISIGKTSRPLVDEDTDNWTLVNCSLFRIFTRDNERTVLAMRVTDTTLPAYLMYKGFIVTVFNYTT